MGISSPACSANVDCDSKTGFMDKCVLWSIVELETLNSKPIWLHLCRSRLWRLLNRLLLQRWKFSSDSHAFGPGEPRHQCRGPTHGIRIV